MKNVKVNSEIGRLKVVLLHEPGDELHNLTPKKLDDLLFDDIPWLPLAKKEHQAFAKTFKDAGVKVVYLTDLMTEVLDSSSDIKNEFVEQFIKEAHIKSNTLREVATEYLKAFKDNKELVLKTIAGIKRASYLTIKLNHSLIMLMIIHSSLIQCRTYILLVTHLPLLVMVFHLIRCIPLLEVEKQSSVNISLNIIRRIKPHLYIIPVMRM